jgi:hypothetical protein
MKRLIAAGVSILVAWSLLDALVHRLFLAPLYEADPGLWRPVAQMNVALIWAVTLILIGIFVGIYRLLVRPKSLVAGLGLGAFLGLALGVASGIGTFIHMPIPLALACGWLIAGWLKGVVAGGIIGALVVDAAPPRPHEPQPLGASQ